ncbi:MAG: IS91 family transposase [Firmicutes bacterium]|nr:IS91 family transposase [Bacillota bacterium]
MPEIQDVFNAVKPYGLSPDQRKAFYAIRSCRTDTLGSHTDRCSSCGHIHISYNSCRNRHCPKCQGSKQEEWARAQLSKVLPTQYFHVVFTLPKELNTIIYQNQRLLYSILLKSAGDTITELSKDPKFLGAQVGATAVLHTWGQNLCFHPHVHCIVPGGGLSNDGLRFVHSSKKFFIPVKVMSRKFRGKVLYYLKEAFKNGNIQFFKDAAMLDCYPNFLNFINSLYQTDWVVYCKKPFKSPLHVVNYLGRYTHRVAISNSRIVDFDEANVTFRWKDYRDKNKVKLMTLKTDEFVRRFLLHVLPSGFTKIRHYGILSSRNISTKLTLCIRLAGVRPVVPKVVKHVYACPVCGGAMIFAGIISDAYAVP